MARNILFLVEGESAEVKFLKKLNRITFTEDSYEIFSYGTTIYELYDELKKDDTIDILGLLREKSTNPNKRPLLSNYYSSIFLIFDFDPHYHKYTFNALKEMLIFFSDDRENGKLYLNYPMVESIRHLKTMPDKSFRDRCIDFDSIIHYKSIVNLESNYTDIGKYTYDTIFQMLCHHIAKVEYLVLGKWDLPSLDEYENDYHQRLLELLVFQDRLIMDRSISVIATSLFFLIDLKPKSFFTRCKHHSTI